MRHGPTALLTTTPTVTRILVRMDDDVVLKAALLPCYGLPHPQALPALWHQAPTYAVVSAGDVTSAVGSRLDSQNDLGLLPAGQ